MVGISYQDMKKDKHKRAVIFILIIQFGTILQTCIIQLRLYKILQNYCCRCFAEIIMKGYCFFHMECIIYHCHLVCTYQSAILGNLLVYMILSIRETLLFFVIKIIYFCINIILYKERCRESQNQFSNELQLIRLSLYTEDKNSKRI